jgi:hypothetical protein
MDHVNGMVGRLSYWFLASGDSWIDWDWPVELKLKY